MPLLAIGGDSHAPVNTTYIGTQVLGMSVMPLARAAKDPSPIFTAADVGTFTGREWLADEVDRFITRHPCGYIFVEAEAGLGKTAFAAWLVKTRGYLSHFSRYSGGGSVQGPWRTCQLNSSFGLAWMTRHPEVCCRSGPRLLVDSSRCWRWRPTEHMSEDNPSYWWWMDWTRLTRLRRVCRTACLRCCQMAFIWSQHTALAAHLGARATIPVVNRPTGRAHNSRCGMPSRTVANTVTHAVVIHHRA